MILERIKYTDKLIEIMISLDQLLRKFQYLIDQFKIFKNCSMHLKTFVKFCKKFSDEQKINNDTNHQNKEFLLKDINYLSNFCSMKVSNTKNIDKLT